ncbi:MAG: Outer membrane protein TolC precursor [Syntrophaceae bacterium PtaU1.Bin231]|nr:MAG: Outer membrane protein TolC precursor [Syntrophaceae bacterium PtaU1.Bin231]
MKTNGIRFPLLFILVCLGWVLSLFPAVDGHSQEQKPRNPSPAQGASPAAAIGQDSNVLTLERCIEIALEKNPEIAAARSDITAAEARFDAARAAYWPQLSAEGGYLRYVDNQRLIAARFNGELGVFDNDLLRADLVVRWPLFTGGRISSEAGAAEKLSEAEKKKFIRTRDELVYSVTAVYFSIRGQQSIIDSLKFSKGALDQHRKRVLQLYEAQKAAKVDLLRTEVRLADVNQNIIREENVLATQTRILFSLMGYEDAPENIRFEEKFALPSEESLDPGRLVESALKNRPDYRAAQERVEAQVRRVAAAKAGHWPSVNLVGSYGVRSAPSPENRGRDTQSMEDTGFAGAVLSVPLFEGGRVSATISEETALLAAAKERMKRLEIQIRQEAETAALDIQSSVARFRATEKSVEQARESLRIETLKYDLGKGSITDVLDAHAALLQAETSYCRACIDYQISRARLKLATGGAL